MEAEQKRFVCTFCGAPKRKKEVLMKRFVLNKFSMGITVAAALAAANAQALTLDWSGYFRADHTYVRNFQLEGKSSTTISSLFMRLKPRVLVNDNVIVRSEWNIGDPVTGFFGRGIPREDRNNPLSTGKDPFAISASRLWLDVHTDFGTLQVGRAPFHWGLGVIFNSGDDPFDRFQTTSDTIRLVSKFGYLSLMPIYAKNSFGRAAAGSRNPTTNAILQGGDDVTDYGLGLKYDNPEEDIEGGALFYKRNAPDSQNAYYYPAGSAVFTPGANGMNLRLINLYAKKSWSKFEIGAEVPLYSGDIGDMNGVGSRNLFSATAVAVEAALKFDTWKHSLKVGTVPGQGAANTGNRGRNFGALEFHRGYKLGQVLFNYNLGHFGPANPDAVPGSPSAGDVVVSPYDSAISNAKYVMFSSEKRWEQWGVNFGVVWAQANQTAEAGKDFYNHRARRWFTSTGKQSSNIGLEVDLGARYNWDDNISFGADAGVLMPGDYLKFTDSVTGQGTNKKVLAGSLTAATVF